MKDGSTRELKTRDTDGLFGQFMTKFQASLVILNGPATGTDCTIDSQRLVIGRGPGVDLHALGRLPGIQNRCEHR